MKNPSLIREHWEYLLADPDRGVLGLVDEILMASRQQDLWLTWRVGRLDVAFLEGGHRRAIEVPFRKSIFRAALARIAALCNERSPGSVSPYGGQGEVTIDADSPRTIRVRFVNTPETLSLELSSVSAEVGSLTNLSPVQSPK